MKKMIAVILTAGILLTGTTAYAAGGTTAGGIKTRVSEKIQEASEKVQAFKAESAEISDLVSQIRANRAQLLTLNNEATAAYREAKSKVAELLKDKDNLTQEQIDKLKEALDILKTDRRPYADTLGDIAKETLKLREARRDTDVEGYKQALNDIISVQQTRIESIQKAIGDMKTINEI